MPENALLRQALIEKIQTQPHPVYGTANPRFYNRKKSKPAEMLVLTEEEKHQLWPDAVWPRGRVVKMTRTQLQQALKGNFMLPGEETLRVELQIAALNAQYPNAFYPKEIPHDHLYHPSSRLGLVQPCGLRYFSD